MTGDAAFVTVRNLTHRFDVSRGLIDRLVSGGGRRYIHAVSDVNFEIARGETFALVGESGSGKSTIARLVCGLYRPETGEIRIGDPGQGETRDEARRRTQMIFQDPHASLNPRWRVDRIVREPIRELPRAVAARRVGELLNLVGLHVEDGRKYVHQFSGGQRQRIAIARSLAANAPFLVCDEPTSALDVSVQAQILNLMRDLQGRLGLTYLFISHNLAVVRFMASRVGVLYLGRLVEVAPAERLFSDPRHPYTRLLLDAVPGTGRTRAPAAGAMPGPMSQPTGCSFHPRCPLAVEKCRRLRPELIHGVACHVANGDT